MEGFEGEADGAVDGEEFGLDGGLLVEDVSFVLEEIEFEALAEDHQCVVRHLVHQAFPVFLVVRERVRGVEIVCGHDDGGEYPCCYPHELVENRPYRSFLKGGSVPSEHIDNLHDGFEDQYPGAWFMGIGRQELQGIQYIMAIVVSPLVAIECGCYGGEHGGELDGGELVGVVGYLDHPDDEERALLFFEWLLCE